MKVFIILIGLCIISITVRAYDGPITLLENLILESE